MNKDPCACMGPQGNDPMCPCAMIQAGLEPFNPWTPEKKEELNRVLSHVFNFTNGRSDKEPSI